MIIFRILLFPLALLYGGITALRNKAYDWGILRSYTFPVPIIAVGNLSVGGTGKTPQIEQLIRLLQPYYRIATLSRGYRRKSKGYWVANDLTDTFSKEAILGDEPYQIHRKFPEVTVAVDADRVRGITQLLARKPQPELILLDDAFQHRRVKAGLYILLTAYDDLYCNDWMLPSGTLREFTSGVQRAHMIIVTKCPPNLSELAQQKIRQRLSASVPVFFSTIVYEDGVYDGQNRRAWSSVNKADCVFVTGIAKPKPFLEFVGATESQTLQFPDHHSFTPQDIERMNREFSGKIVITTEKDFVRLHGKGLQLPLYYLPMQSQLLHHENQWKQLIQDYVETSTRNR
ncbi:tetraacyldisaccharide 4'-kinase [Flavobacterium sp.]|jgi:tetraacyldisaccharide 4'-kinase|uniref:tetraacyldisaccharide 4'-kinase n=1 Tax=Flavobacterium sp. TaxID=239 RepID=UPI00333F92CC